MNNSIFFCLSVFLGCDPISEESILARKSQIFFYQKVMTSKCTTVYFRAFKVILLCLVILILSGCQGEETTSSKFVLHNQSGWVVKIAPSLTLSDTLIIKSNQVLEYGFGFERGITPGIGGAFFADGFPVTVIFDNQFLVTHYRDSNQHSGRFYNMLSDRCFYNTSSYIKKIDNPSKTSRFVTLTYKFTAEDYAFAKQ